MRDQATPNTTSDDNYVQPVPRIALRPREAAAALGIGTRKLWEITADRTSGIPHTRFGKVVVYPVDELCRWLAKQAKAEGEHR